VRYLLWAVLLVLLDGLVEREVPAMRLIPVGWGGSGCAGFSAMMGWADGKTLPCPHSSRILAGGRGGRLVGGSGGVRMRGL